MNNHRLLAYFKTQHIKTQAKHHREHGITQAWYSPWLSVPAFFSVVQSLGFSTLAICGLWLALMLPAAAKVAAPAASDVAANARLVELSAELRCLVCQNESLASSRAPLAEDLRREVRERIAAGDSNPQIIRHLTDRYGDFVTYRPPFKTRTLLLWLLPPLLLLIGLFLLLRQIRRRKAAPGEADPARLAALRAEFDGTNNGKDTQ
ncbi:cytochrome c-type biogenesis protein CcmH [Iodobacter sp. HSC-16F04]|uniref:Cytochrome c-type biogenesis protein n=1 Tax=Iodobacter violaceini TaxID=3044271 RepID=A0ABX0KMN2_9NEIS|nr:cytochrome c-type biogenesis protein [Iodobacter violacea]NHQ85640.1 cytochrome c-type biogenesis protein CcmH [Iodobacter violacea]